MTDSECVELLQWVLPRLRFRWPGFRKVRRQVRKRIERRLHGLGLAGAGHLSLDVDLALVGTAYHFRKLHGEPRLVLRARHENLSRFVSAMVWAGLCPALATVAICGLRRPDAAALAARGWPRSPARPGCSCCRPVCSDWLCW